MTIEANTKYKLIIKAKNSPAYSLARAYLTTEYAFKYLQVIIEELGQDFEWAAIETTALNDKIITESYELTRK